MLRIAADAGVPDERVYNAVYQRESYICGFMLWTCCFFGMESSLWVGAYLLPRGDSRCFS